MNSMFGDTNINLVVQAFTPVEEKGYASKGTLNITGNCDSFEIDQFDDILYEFSGAYTIEYIPKNSRTSMLYYGYAKGMVNIYYIYNDNAKSLCSFKSEYFVVIINYSNGTYTVTPYINGKKKSSVMVDVGNNSMKPIIFYLNNAYSSTTSTPSIKNLYIYESTETFTDNCASQLFNKTIVIYSNKCMYSQYFSEMQLYNSNFSKYGVYTKGELIEGTKAAIYNNGNIEAAEFIEY